jgi:ribosomal protein S18 acetylase RimI-like enzyme
VPDLRILPSLVPHLSDLSTLLMDVVEHGAGVSFLHPLTREDADAFWLGQDADVRSGATVQFGSFVEGVLIGTVQLKRAWAPNQKHHSDIAKLLVHSAHRRLGIATHLMRALEEQARTLDQTLLTFDASAHGSVEDFYRRLGYTCVGYFPGYALSSLGELEDTALFFKKL